jgi:tellurite resistance-related uncharacterized protein
VRHRPPFRERPWVTTDAGRAGRIGADLDCPLCDRAELPEGLSIDRVAGPFDETTIPAGLRRSHRTPPRTWGRLHVLEGRIGLRMDTDPPFDRELQAGESQPIPPEVRHEIRVVSGARLEVEFLVARS